MKPYWSAPELWPEATFVIVGSGPSLTAAQVEACRGREANGQRVRVIAVNNGYQIAPFADVLYFCDDKWWQWHHKHLAQWPGLIARLDGGHFDFGDARIKVLRNTGQHKGLCAERNGLNTGQNSGYQAINLAVHLGAALILLLGFDMKGVLEGRSVRTHWHKDHPGGTNASVYDQMRPHFESLVAPLSALGVGIVNCTPGSAIDCFRRGDIHRELGACAQAA